MESKEERAAGGRRYGVVRVTVEDEARIRGIAQKLGLSVEDVNDRLSAELLATVRVQGVLAQIVKEECSEMLGTLMHFADEEEFAPSRWSGVHLAGQRESCECRFCGELRALESSIDVALARVDVLDNMADAGGAP